MRLRITPENGHRLEKLVCAKSGKVRRAQASTSVRLAEHIGRRSFRLSVAILDPSQSFGRGRGSLKGDASHLKGDASHRGDASCDFPRAFEEGAKRSRGITASYAPY